MCFIKDVPMGSPKSTIGDPMILNALVEMLRNGQGKNITTMVHEVSLKMIFNRFNYFMF